MSVLEQDEEICKIQTAIAAGMVTNASHLQTYLKTWDKHREIWEIEKDIFIQRYQRLNPAVSSFDSDIARFFFFYLCYFCLIKLILVFVLYVNHYMHVQFCYKYY